MLSKILNAVLLAHLLMGWSTYVDAVDVVFFVPTEKEDNQYFTISVPSTAEVDTAFPQFLENYKAKVDPTKYNDVHITIADKTFQKGVEQTQENVDEDAGAPAAYCQIVSYIDRTKEAVEFAINKAIVLKLRANAYQISGHIGSKATDGSLVNWNYHKIDLNPVSYPPASRKAGDV